MNEKDEQQKDNDWLGDNRLEGELSNFDDFSGSDSYKNTIKKTKSHFDKFDLTEPFRKFVIGKKK